MTSQLRCPTCGELVVEPARCLQGHPQPDRPPIQLEGFAKLIAEELRSMLAEEFRVAAAAMPPKPDPAALVRVKEFARHAGVSETFVYEHQHELGVIRLGTGPKAPLRFDLERSLARLAELREQGVVKVGPQPQQRRELPTDVELLPVKGRAA